MNYGAMQRQLERGETKRATIFIFLSLIFFVVVHHGFFGTSFLFLFTFG